MEEPMIEVALHVVSVMLGIAALLAFVRIVKGPSILDRVVASEVLLSTIMLALITHMVRVGNTRTLMVVLVVALLGFTASVSVARFVSAQDHQREEQP
jgi:multicomponent Na+:H+ antiporter subunit F